jgi:phage gpG-like protein
MQPVVRVEGAKELARALRAANSAFPAQLRFAHEHAAEVVVDAALPNVPFRSGDLRRSTGGRGTERQGIAESKTPYAAAIHWGRAVGNVGRPPGNLMGPNRIKGRPYLWDAARAKENEIADQFDEMLAEIIRIIERS